jgi:hypothetical protein
MAATTSGKLVTAASTRAPTTISGTANRLPSADAARSIITLAAATTSSDLAATAASWGRRSTREKSGGYGWVAC